MHGASARRAFSETEDATIALNVGTVIEPGCFFSETCQKRTQVSPKAPNMTPKVLLPKPWGSTNHAKRTLLNLLRISISISIRISIRLRISISICAIHADIYLYILVLVFLARKESSSFNI